MPNKPTREQIEHEENEAGSDVADGRNKYPGMSYAQGVSDALRWVLGLEDEPPYTGD